MKNILIFKQKDCFHKKVILFVCLFVLSFYMQAQFNYFNKSYPDKSSNITYDLFQENDTSFIVKSPFVDLTGYSGLSLFKINSKGVKYFQKDFYLLDSATYYTFGNSYYATTNRMVKTSASSFFIINGYLNKHNKQSAIITKHNISNLDTTLIKLISDTMYEYDVEQCKLLPDGNIIILGSLFDNANTSIPGKTLLIKMDTLGNVIWQNSFLIGVSCNGFSIEYNIHNKGYILTGQENNNTNVYAYLATTDSLGNMINYHVLGNGPGSSMFSNIVALSNGDFILAGEYDTVQCIQPQFYAGKPYLVRTDNVGNILWQKDMYPFTNTLGSLISVVQLNDGNFIACGYNEQTTYQFLNDTGLLGLIMKIDNSGNLLWDRTYRSPIASNSYSLNNIKKISDTTFIVCGAYEQGSSTKGWILTINSFGCDSIDCLNAMSTKQILLNNQVKVYPNPGSNYITITATQDVSEVKIFNVLGKEVIGTKEKEIDISYLNNGVYFIQAKAADKIYTTKFIKE